MNEAIVIFAIGIPFVALVWWLGRRVIAAFILIAAHLHRWCHK